MKDNQLKHNIKPQRPRGQNGTAGGCQKTPVRTKLFCLHCNFHWKSNGVEKYTAYAKKYVDSSCPHCKSICIAVLKRQTRVPKRGSNAMKRFIAYLRSGYY